MVHSLSPKKICPHAAPRAVPFISRVSPPNGDDVVGDILVTIGVKDESYMKLPPEADEEPMVIEMSDADLLYRLLEDCADVMHSNSSYVDFFYF